MKKAPTITDVARMLNLSVSTVSRVMNGRDRVSDETRKKVLDAVKKMNYVPNYAAVSIVKKQSKVIVALVPDLNTPFFLSVVQGIEEIAKSQGFFTMVFSSNGSSLEEHAFINGTMGRSVDGAIVIPSTPDLSFYTDYSKPIVFVDRFNNDYSFDSVSVDNFRGSYIAVEHMIKMGHKKIAIITGPKELNVGQERYWGFDQAMREYDIKPDDKYIRICDWTESDGYNNTKDLLNMEDPPTAIFAANENICRGILKAIHNLDIELGKDISLVGFDDNELAKFSNPKVTVISRATNEMGKIGASLLLEKINNKESHSIPQGICLPVKLIIRGSVKKLN